MHRVFRQAVYGEFKKKHNFHPYKVKLVQELNEDDYDRRLQFCEIMSTNLTNNVNLLYNICFSDECMFFFEWRSEQA